MPRVVRNFWVAGTIDVHALRHFRAHAQWGNWLKDLTTEQYRLIYEQPIYPKNLYAGRAPYKHDEYRREVLEPNVQRLQERGIYAPQEAGTVPVGEPVPVDIPDAPAETELAAPSGLA